MLSDLICHCRRAIILPYAMVNLYVTTYTVQFSVLHSPCFRNLRTPGMHEISEPWTNTPRLGSGVTILTRTVAVRAAINMPLHRTRLPRIHRAAGVVCNPMAYLHTCGCVTPLECSSTIDRPSTIARPTHILIQEYTNSRRCSCVIPCAGTYRCRGVPQSTRMEYRGNAISLLLFYLFYRNT